MAKAFLTAAWRNLIMANYTIDPLLLQRYLPRGTEPDTFNNEYYVSLVGFLFDKVKLRNIAFPFHTRFEEVNLRFYVRYKEHDVWKRGVVFMKEIVPRRMISLIANTLYGEHYATHKMKHEWKETEDELLVSYQWKTGAEWNYINCVAAKEAAYVPADSAEAFITEHYWGYTFIDAQRTGVYEVVHPKWKIHAVKSYDIFCNTKHLYGEQFEDTLKQQPRSVFLAAGSPVQVMTGAKIND